MTHLDKSSIRRIVEKSTYNPEKLSSRSRTFSWRSSSERTTPLAEMFWNIESNVRKQKFLECMKLKHLLIGLSVLELQMLVDEPSLLRDQMYLACLREIALSSTNVDNLEQRRILVARLQRLRSMLGLPYWNLNLLNTYLGNLSYSIVLSEQPIHRTKKYSGYVRTPSAVGSKSSRKIFQDLPLEIFDPTLVEVIDYTSYFSSGELDFSTLGYSESPIYTILREHFEREQELPDSMKHLLFFREI